MFRSWQKVCMNKPGIVTKCDWLICEINEFAWDTLVLNYTNCMSYNDLFWKFEWFQVDLFSLKFWRGGERESMVSENGGMKVPS